MKAIVTSNNVDYAEWTLFFEYKETTEENLRAIAKLDEVWQTLDASFDTEGLAIGCLSIGSDVEETYAYFDMKDMARQAIYEIVRNHGGPGRIERTEKHLRAVQGAFADIVELFDQAIKDPFRFSEPPNASQNGPEWDEKLNYIKQMCGG